MTVENSVVKTTLVLVEMVVLHIQNVKVILIFIKTDKTRGKGEGISMSVDIMKN